MLIEAGADVNAKTYEDEELTPVIIASWQGHTGIVKQLIEAGADVNAKSKFGTALNAAGIQFKEDIKKILKEAGAK